MKGTIHLADPEESFPVEIDARDRRAFERSASVQLGKSADMPLRELIARAPETYMTWLAWHSFTKRQGGTLSWSDFESRLVEIESDDSGDELDPTLPGHIPG